MVNVELVAMVTALMLSMRDAVVSLSYQDTGRAINISRQKNNQAKLSLFSLQQQRGAPENIVFLINKYLV